MVKCFLNWLKTWLLCTLRVFFGVRLRYRRIYAGCDVCYMVSS